MEEQNSMVEAVQNELLNKTHVVEEIAEPNEEAKFTQSDVNRIVSKRLTEERSKLEADFQRKEQEFRQKEYQLFAEDTLKNRGFGKDILSILKADDQESLLKCMDILEQEAERQALERINRHLRQSAPGSVSNFGMSTDSAIRQAMSIGKGAK